MIDTNFFSNNGPFTLQHIADVLNCKLLAPTNTAIEEAVNINVTNINSLEEATNSEITFFSNKKYFSAYQNTQALACIVTQEYATNESTSELTSERAPNIWKIIASNPYKSYAEVTNLFYPATVEQNYIARSANIHHTAKIGKNCYIGDNVVIEQAVNIADNCWIDSGTVIKHNVIIGKNSRISANVFIAYAIIGDDVLILPGVVIGSDGFGFATDQGKHYKVAQLGRVIIGNDVEIGSNTTIDRGSLGDTVIGDLCRIDNLVQIAHNVTIGRGSIIVAQVGIAGSTKIGSYCIIAGQAGINGHITIGDYCHVAAQSGVAKDLADKSIVGGTPAQNLRDWHRQQIIMKTLKNK